MKEIEIPEGYEARIEGNKVVLELKDERIRKNILALVKKHAVNHERCQMEAYLEKQKKAQPGDEDRYMVGYMNGMNDALKEQKPAEWSEEDEQWLEAIIKDYENSLIKDKDHAAVIKIEIDFLKSLPERFSPQSHWKPSEEQMEALFAASERNDKLGAILNNLYNDLKKL